MCFIRSRQNYLSRYHAIISYFFRLPSRKMKPFPVPWVYLIPFRAISKPNFPIFRLKKWQIPRPEIALLGPFYLAFTTRMILSSYTEPLFVSMLYFLTVLLFSSTLKINHNSSSKMLYRVHRYQSNVSIEFRAIPKERESPRESTYDRESRFY